MRYDLDHLFLVPKGTPVDVFLGTDTEDSLLVTLELDQWRAQTIEVTFSSRLHSDE